MNRMFSLLILLAVTFSIGCGGPKQPFTPYREGAIVLTVKGMHCSNCEGAIMTALSNTKGVEWARAENELEQVAYTGSVSKADVVEAIKGVGFEVVE